MYYNIIEYFVNVFVVRLKFMFLGSGIDAVEKQFENTFNSVSSEPNQQSTNKPSFPTKYECTGVSLTEEENRICELDGNKVPSTYPLTQEEERNQKIIQKKLGSGLHEVEKEYIQWKTQFQNNSNNGVIVQPNEQSRAARPSETNGMYLGLVPTEEEKKLLDNDGTKVLLQYNLTKEEEEKEKRNLKIINKKIKKRVSRNST